MLIDAQQFLISSKSLGASSTTASGSTSGAGADTRPFLMELQSRLSALAATPETANQAVASSDATSVLAEFQSTINLFKGAQATASEGTASAKEQAEAVATRRSTLQQEFNTYFDTTQPGQVIQSGGGAVTRNADGSATWSGDGRTYTYNRTTSLEDVASNTGLGAEWASTYGVDLRQTGTTTSATIPATSTSDAVATAPFSTFEEFRAWEAGLGHTFAADYETPDYVNMMGLSLGGGEDEAFKRFVFFKNNPQYAADFESIHEGHLSQFPTDGTTLIKSDLTQMPSDVAAFYRENPDQLRLAEGFNMDPVLYKMQMDGTLTVPSGTNSSEWLMQNKWTAAGVVPNDNRVSYAQASYRGLDGTGAGNYRMAQYNAGTGGILDFDGKTYNAVTGAVMA